MQLADHRVTPHGDDGMLSFKVTPVRGTFVAHSEAALSEGSEGFHCSALSFSRRHNSQGDVIVFCLSGSVGQLQRTVRITCRTIGLA